MLSIVLILACGSEPTSTPVLNNEPPISNAGSDLAVGADQPIELDGGGSFDPEGESLTFDWVFQRVPQGSELDESSFTINGSNIPTTSFIADSTGMFIVGLTVTDASGVSSETDAVIVQVESGQKPVAVAGEDLILTVDEEVVVDGSGSYDPLGRELSYQWSIASKPSASIATLSTPEESQTSFAPDFPGLYLLSLKVNSGSAISDPDIVQLQVESDNPSPPSASAGEDLQGIYACEQLQLDGSQSFDPNGDALTYFWSLQSKPGSSEVSNDSIEDREAQETQIFLDQSGEYSFSLAVNDGTEWSSPDLLNVSAIERPNNSAPAVNAGSVLSADAGNSECSESGYSYYCGNCDSVSLDIGAGASAYDNDGDPVEYLWTSDAGEASFADETSKETQVVLSGAAPSEPGVCEITEFELRLSVTDCPGASSSDVLTVEVSCCGVFGN